MKNFEKFTNLFEINRRLNFSLLPFEQTKIELEKDGIIEKDREWERNYQEIKVFLDKLHRTFIEEVIDNIYLENLDKYYKSYLEYKEKKDKTSTTALNKTKKELKSEFLSFFEAKGNEWRNKYELTGKGGINILNGKEVLKLLKLKFPKYKNLFDKYNDKFDFLKQYVGNRSILYKENAKKGSVITRTIDENLEIFLKNKEAFENFIKEEPKFFTVKEKKIFNLEFYNNCISQEGINKYNQFISGEMLNNGERKIGINERINLLKQKDKKDIKYPIFKFLYKQIIAEEEKENVITTLENKEDLFKLINNSIEVHTEKIKKISSLLNTFVNNINNDTFDFTSIYITKNSFNNISNIFFKDIDTSLGIIEDFKKSEYISLNKFKDILNSNETNLFKKLYITNNIVLENKLNFENFFEILIFELNNKVAEINGNLEDIKGISCENFKKSKDEISIIKKYFDSVLNFYRLIKIFKIKEKIEVEKDISFYEPYDMYIYNFKIFEEYELVRNFLVKKEIKKDKLKISFSYARFLRGWDKGEEKTYCGTILRKEEKYFLLILKKGYKDIFDEYKEEGGEDSFYEKMEYKQIGQARTFIHLAFPKNDKAQKLEGVDLEAYMEIYKNYGFTKEIAEIKEEILKKGNTKVERSKLKTLINYFKNVLSCKYKDIYDIEPILNKEYEEIDDFLSDIEKMMYKIKFIKFSEKYINKLEKEGKVYLFQIYNKDFAENKKAGSKENIHTKYFKSLFLEDNLKDLKIKLNGGAKMFFREKTDNLKKKTTKSGKEILEHKRYSKDTFILDINISINKSAKILNFNKYLNENFKPKHIIGIDRGEKHLTYYSVVDLNGKIVDTGSLNIINEIDYLTKLEEKEKSRKDLKINWLEIENIKNLKKGYVSALVNKLCDLILKYEGYIVFEDLNSGFIKTRQKIEKQVYQQIELALAKKLNYLTLKEKSDKEIGGTLNGIQIVPEYQGINKFKQTGIILYTNPAYTSTTCPKCSWRKTLKFPIRTTLKELKNLFNDIKITFEKDNFYFSYKNDNTILEKIGTNNIERYFWDRNKKTNNKINLKDNLIKLFEENNINLKNISEDISKNNLGLKFYEKLFFYFNLLNTIRNSDNETKRDIISCPCCGYHSDEGLYGKEFNGDANGAYNIARKGIIMYGKIKTNPEKPELFVSNKDWDDFLNKF